MGTRKQKESGSTARDKEKNSGKGGLGQVLCSSIKFKSTIMSFLVVTFMEPDESNSTF